MDIKNNFNCAEGCPIEAFLYLFGGKWRGVIAYQIALNNGVGFNFLLDKIQGISKRSLALQLNFLKNKGVIQKTTITEKPLKIDYTLTEYGKEVVPILKKMEKWFHNNHDIFLKNYFEN